MALLINKDGKQLGPFSLEQAREAVLAGRFDADDWAWPDGATDWVQLKDVPGFAAMARPARAPSALPGASAAMPDSAVPAEEELWRGHPSQLLNFGTYLFWAIVFAVGVFAAWFVSFQSRSWAFAIVAGAAAVALAACLWAFFHLRTFEYVITTQRVRVISGLLGKDVEEIELFRVKDTAARQSILLRPFGLGTITVVSGDEKHPRLVLSGVPHALEMRERLRSEVLNLRQRFGVRELDVM